MTNFKKKIKKDPDPEDVQVVEFMYLVFTRMPGELPWATQDFVVVFVLRISSAN